MNSKQLKRLVLMGCIPFNPKWFGKRPRMGVFKRLMKDGWRQVGLTFTGGNLAVWCRDQEVYLSRSQAVYPADSVNASYQIWGKVIRRQAVWHDLCTDATEERKVVYVSTPDSHFIRDYSSYFPMDEGWDI